MRMLHRIFSLTSLALTICIAAEAQVTNASKGCSGKNGLTSIEISDLLTAQNKIRTENKLAPFTWDCTLADTAQEWASRGVFEHRVGIKFGESLFVSSSTAAKAVMAVQQWMVEKANWDNNKGVCAPGKVCTHYTQIVWKTTARIGCGVNRNAPGRWKVFLVCNYDPAGNGTGPAF